MDRRLLWQDLKDHHDLQMFRNNAWLICGDFNEILSTSDHSNITNSFDFSGMNEFQHMVNYCSMTDLPTQGPHYTWCNKREDGLICKKIDRIMCNQHWLGLFADSYGVYEGGGCSDHLRVRFHLKPPVTKRRVPFKFVNSVAAHPHFQETIKEYWDTTSPLYASTTAAYIFSKKLKALKLILRQLGKQHVGHIQRRVKEAYDDLCQAQEANHMNPTSRSIDKELAAQRAWEDLSIIEEQYLRQKSKIHWLYVGDKNNAYFQKMAKTRQLRNSIKEIKDVHGKTLTEANDIKQEAARFFKDFLASSPTDLQTPSASEIASFVRFRCSDEDRSNLVMEVTTDEIKQTLFRMPKNKSPGPDGYTVEFFTAAWSVLGEDFTVAVQSFFKFGFLPKGLNSTILALIPKKENALEMKDYRPISCCNVLYKVISKILANRLKLILPRVILRNQSAFVQGRLLLENVLLATEIVRDYHKVSISKRCTTKFDISKAFDTVQWSFLHDTLAAMAVPNEFTRLVMLCVSTPSFSVQINGELAGYFNSSRGLRQGCSLSPYLFVICMNVLSNMLDIACLNGRIGYHPKCRNLMITHLCFADDILVFSDGTHHSMEGIVDVFKRFALTSGLQISLEKSTIYPVGFTTQEKAQLLDTFQFAEGSFPIKYLGLPLVTRKLTLSDCLPLISKLKEKVSSWTTRFLSYAGRLQLINSVLVGVINFWLSAYCLPKQCLVEIDRICAAFLWSGPDLNTRKAKVSWNDICIPKQEGGLGIRNLLESMKVCYLKLIWRIITRQPSLWVSWIWESLIRTGTIWSINENTTTGSWIWRKILKHRLDAQKLYKFEIGNGGNISFWFDNWSNYGSLFSIFGSRGTIDFGIPKDATLQYVLHNRRPRRTRQPLINLVEDALNVLASRTTNTNIEDIVLWKSTGTKYLTRFSSKSTLVNTREQRLKLVWPNLIWFNHATPKFAFCSWLAFQDRLSTGDRMKQWNINAHTRCTLCCQEEETRDHLFFEYTYSKAIWRKTIGTLLGKHHTTSWQLWCLL